MRREIEMELSRLMYRVVLLDSIPVFEPVLTQSIFVAEALVQGYYLKITPTRHLSHIGFVSPPQKSQFRGRDEQSLYGLGVRAILHTRIKV